MNAPPQVSWIAIEEGAHVFSAEGEAVGKVTRAVGDAEADVFTGLAVKLSAFGSERFVPSERVRAIWPDRVDLDVTAADVEKLPEHEDAPVVRLGPRPSSFFRRLFGRR
jgi:hypothetical protein